MIVQGGVPRNVSEVAPLAVSLTPKPSTAPFLLCSQAAPSTPRTQCAIKYNRDVDWRANLITETSREHRGSVVATVAIKETQLLTINVSNTPGVCTFR